MVCQSVTQNTDTEDITAGFGPSTSEKDVDVILVVDDSPDNLFLTESILAEDGYEVICAESGEAALALIKEVCPDLVLLDIMMPGIDGYEVTRRIRGNPNLPYIPILLVTAHDQPCVVDGLDTGADDFIRKPIVEVDELLARVRSLLRLKHTMDERDHIARQREDFVSRLTHDLRTPLIAADRMLSMINNGTFGDVPGAIAESIDTVICNNRSLLAMVNTLLEVYRHDAGSKALTYSRFNLCKLLDEVIEELLPLAQEQGIRLISRCQSLESAIADSVHGLQNGNGHHNTRQHDHGILTEHDGDARTAIAQRQSSRRHMCKVVGDRLELRRVITNLVGNAIKFTDQGSVEVGVDFLQAGTDGQALPGGESGPLEQDYVVLSVKDTGAGISEEDQQEIFERFRQGKNKRAGNGLGLHLSQRIVQAHGGTITVESKLGEGSTFTMFLPMGGML